MKKYYPKIVFSESFIFSFAALLFSIPDVRLFGATSFSLQFFFLFSVLLFGFNHRSFEKYFRHNLPFFFLIFSGLISAPYVLMNSRDNNDIYFVIGKNKDLFTELMLAYLFYVFYLYRGRAVFSAIRVFSEVYFILNFGYYLLLRADPYLIGLFHSSIDGFYGFESGREAFLGWEPSYTGPTAFILAGIYFCVSELSFRSFLVFLISSFVVILSASKTVYIMLVVLLVFFAFYVLSRISRFLSSIFIVVGASLFFASFSFVLSGFSFADLDYLEYGSLITRSELSGKAIELLIVNPLGYGFGNGVLVLSDSVSADLGRLVSLEHLNSARFARTPKSQILEAALGGGLVFLILFFYSIRRLFRDIVAVGRLKALELGVLVSIVTCMVGGERVACILFLNILWLIGLEDRRFGDSLTSSRFALESQP